MSNETKPEDSELTVSGSEEVYLKPEDGFEILPGIVETEYLAGLQEEMRALEIAITNPFKKMWQTPRDAKGAPGMKNQYFRTEVLELMADPAFAETYPLTAGVVEKLKRHSGLQTVDTLNINHYPPLTQIPGHHDPEQEHPHRIYSVGVLGNGVFRIWPDETTDGWIPNDPDQAIKLSMQSGDAVGLISISKYNMTEEPYDTRYSTDPDINADVETYLTRYHSAENPTDQERIILLVGLH